MGSGKDDDRNMQGKPGSAISVTDSEANPLGDVPSAPSHRNRGAAREEIFWEPFRPNAIPPGRRDFDPISFKRVALGLFGHLARGTPAPKRPQPTIFRSAGRPFDPLASYIKARLWTRTPASISRPSTAAASHN